MKTLVAAILLITAANTIFYIAVVSSENMGLSVDEGIKVTIIDNANVRLTMSVEKDWVCLGENLVINFEVKNENADNIWLIRYDRLFYFDVYGENHVKLGTWPCPRICCYPCSGWWWEPVPPGGFYSENLVWDLVAYRENYDYWGENWDRTCPMTSSATIEVCPLDCWPSYERIELEPGIYYLEGHAFYNLPGIAYCRGWNVPELVTPQLEITILSPESI